MAQVTYDRPWQEIAKEKRDSIVALLPEKYNIDPSKYEGVRDVTTHVLWENLTNKDREITETDAGEIVKKTSTGEWTAVEVATAFINRASLAHKLVSCLLEVFFEAALKDAKELDAYYAQHKKPKGPLHGLPVSLKDQCHVKGVETSMGYVGWIGTFQGKKGTGKEKVFESELVRELRNLGAVLYCKTTVPHTLMSAESQNNIHGDVCRNPKNRNLGAGGSSGGEGALLAMRGSPLGFGTDIGGSIRIPAAFNGLYGLRPSTGRVPYEGMANSMDGQNSILSVCGPLSQSLAGVRLAMTAVASQKPWLHDPNVLEIPWRTEHEQEIHEIVSSSGPKLTFGIYPNDGIVTPFPPVRRALDKITKALQAGGHEIVSWEPPSHNEGNELVLKVWSFDGGKDIFDQFDLSGEPPIEPIRSFFGERRPEKPGSFIADVNVAKRDYQKQYMEYWNSTISQTNTGRPVDAFIMPLAPFPAALPGKYSYYGYAIIVNLLDYPSCIIPVTHVDKSIDVVDGAFKPQTPLDKICQDDYDPEVYDGAPVALQIVGRRLNEEKLLAIVAEADKALRAIK